MKPLRSSAYCCAALLALQGTLAPRVESTNTPLAHDAYFIICETDYAIWTKTRHFEYSSEGILSPEVTPDGKPILKYGQETVAVENEHGQFTWAAIGNNHPCSYEEINAGLFDDNENFLVKLGYFRGHFTTYLKNAMRSQINSAVKEINTKVDAKLANAKNIAEDDIQEMVDSRAIDIGQRLLAQFKGNTEKTQQQTDGNSKKIGNPNHDTNNYSGQKIKNAIDAAAEVINRLANKNMDTMVSMNKSIWNGIQITRRDFHLAIESTKSVMGLISEILFKEQTHTKIKLELLAAEFSQPDSTAFNGPGGNSESGSNFGTQKIQQVTYVEMRTLIDTKIQSATDAVLQFTMQKIDQESAKTNIEMRSEINEAKEYISLTTADKISDLKRNAVAKIDELESKLAATQLDTNAEIMDRINVAARELGFEYNKTINQVEMSMAASFDGTINATKISLLQQMDIDITKAVKHVGEEIGFRINLFGEAMNSSINKYCISA